MRLVDKVLSLFPKDYHNEVQVMIQLMSHDDNVILDALTGLAASTVIQLSDIPFSVNFRSQLKINLSLIQVRTTFRI